MYLALSAPYQPAVEPSYGKAERLRRILQHVMGLGSLRHKPEACDTASRFDYATV